MREILFRGKRFDTKDWIYGSLLEDDVIVAKGATDVDEDYIGFSDDWSSVLPDTVGQYTGLTDKNGERAFEGDKIREGESVGIIKFGDGQFYIEWIENKDFLEQLNRCAFEVRRNHRKYLRSRGTAMNGDMIRIIADVKLRGDFLGTKESVAMLLEPIGKVRIVSVDDGKGKK